MRRREVPIACAGSLVLVITQADNSFGLLLCGPPKSIDWIAAQNDQRINGRSTNVAQTVAGALRADTNSRDRICQSRQAWH